MASNVKYLFDVRDPEHLKVLANHMAEKAPQEVAPAKEYMTKKEGSLEPEIVTEEAQIEAPPSDLPSSYENVHLWEKELKSNGWHGFIFNDSRGTHYSIFDSRRVKLIEDQSAEGKFFSKDRPFGKVSGMFGKPLPSDRMRSIQNRDLRFMPDDMGTIFDSPKKAISKGSHGSVVQKGIVIDQRLADQLFSPASAAYFDPGFSPDTYVEKVGFPMMADRMKTTPHVARDGTEFELRGGPDHPDMPINEGKVGWASMAGGQATQLQNAINSTDGIGLVVLMNEDAVASNRTFARIMLHELKHDRKTNKEARKILPEKIKNASQAIREWADKNDKKSLKKFKVKTLEDIEAIYEDLSFEVRKILFTKIADITYKRKVGGFFWKDLMRDVIAYKNEDGYRTGDIVKVIKFEQGDSIVNLEDLGITPDPTYDTSFRGQSISNVQGRVSVFQVMRNAFDLIAEESGKEGRTMTSENAVGAQAFRTVQMRGLTDERFHQKLGPGSLDPRGYDPIKFKSKSGPERKSLEVRMAENQFMPSDGDSNRRSPSVRQRNRFMAPAMARYAMATSRELDRFRN